MKLKRKALTLLLATAMVLGFLPVPPALAAGGDFIVESGYTYNPDGILTFTAPGDYTVSMGAPGTTTDRIVIDAPESTEGNPVSITLDNVYIDVSGIESACAFEIQGNSTVELFNVGHNILKSGSEKAGLQVPAGATVTITSTAGLGEDWGLLEVFGGASAAGIGGAWQGDGGTVTIRRTSVYATGGISSVDVGDGGIGISGAGIGGGAGKTTFPYSGGDGCILTIDDADVKAFNDGYGGAGIGGGSWGGSGGDVTINSGSVEARGWKEGAGIGGGSNYGGDANGGTVTINGGVVRVNGGYLSAGIGGGYQGDGGTVTINGGDIGIIGGAEAAGIGGGRSGDGGTVIVSGGETSSTGGAGAAGIGGGAGGNGATVMITGGNVSARCGITGAGIGGGSGGNGGTVTISGGNVVASGSGTDYGGGHFNGAGIGGGSFGHGGNVTISGGKITAIGGGSAAGIGGGGSNTGFGDGTDGGNGGPVTVSGGTVFAMGAGSGQDIGAGGGGSGGSLDISGSGSVFLRNDSCTPPITTTHEHYDIDPWSSIIYGLEIWTGYSGAYLRLSSLTYDLNNGQGTTAASVTQHIGTTVDIVDSNGIYWPGYSFTGWNTQQDGSGTTYAAYSTFTFPQEDTMLYAQWTALPVDVDPDTNSASVSTDESHGDVLLGGGSVAMHLPSISNVTHYTLNISADHLSDSGGGDGALTINTDIGSVTLPSDMLTGVLGAAGSNAALTIGTGDKSGLSDAVRAAIGDRPLIQFTMSLNGDQVEWNNPDAPVTVAIPYTLTADELLNPESIVIWYIDGSGNTVPVPNGHYNPSNGTVTFSTTHFSNYAVVYHHVSFSDLSETAWYYKSASFIAARGITAGTGEGKFSPGAKLTRGECLVMLMKAYGITPESNLEDNFSDAGDTYYSGYLSASKRLGISTGVGSNLFAPEKTITRQEMFTLVYNTLKLISSLPLSSSGTSLSSFSDADQIADWAANAMTVLTEADVVSGNGGNVCPTDTATRADMSMLLYKLLS